MMLKYGLGVVLGGVFFTLAMGIAIGLQQSPDQVAAQQEETVQAADDRNELHLEAIEGTISDFRGEVTRYADDLWLIEHEDYGPCIVRASEEGAVLTLYFADGSPSTVVEVVSGTGAEFMNLVSALDDPELCNENPSSGSCIDSCSDCENDREHCFCLSYCGCRDSGGLCGWGADSEGECWSRCCG